LVNTQATGYLRIVALSFVFFFVNPTFSGIYNGMGNSKSPFWYMTAGVVLNIILDPLLIFGYGIIPAMGVEGAAWATFLSQMLVFIIFVYRFIIQKEMIELHLSKFRFDGAISKRIFSLGLPVAAESAAFAFFAMVLAKMLAMFGPVAIAVQSIGAQIEALSWMTSSGFATALGSFTGQNFGASNWNRIKTGFQFTIIIGSALGIMVTGVFLFFGSSIFSLFLSDVESQQLGGIYLSILAVSQVFMIYEITTRGAFNGIGKTIPPSVIGIIFTGLRIPIAYMLISFTSLGLLGIWWAISATSVIKGIVLPLWFVYVLSRKSKGLTEVIGKNVSTILSSRLRQQSVIKRIKR
jgi:putative MATE family efflux protein